MKGGSFVCKPRLSLHTQTLRSFVTLSLCNKPNGSSSASVVMVLLEFELTEWQGHKIRCSALVNNKYHWSHNEGWGDCVATEGNRWFNVKSQQTDLCCGVNLHPSWAETQVCFCWDRAASQKSTHTATDGKEQGNAGMPRIKTCYQERDWFHFNSLPPSQRCPPKSGVESI